MAWNLFISYDLNRPGQNYEAVRAAIRSLGQWHQVQYSLFYVHTSHTPQDAYAIVRQAQDARDQLIVINAWAAISSEPHDATIDAIQAIWFEP